MKTMVWRWRSITGWSRSAAITNPLSNAKWQAMIISRENKSNILNSKNEFSTRDLLLKPSTLVQITSFESAGQDPGPNNGLTSSHHLLYSQQIVPPNPEDVTVRSLTSTWLVHIFILFLHSYYDCIYQCIFEIPYKWPIEKCLIWLDKQGSKELINFWTQK